MEAREEEAQKEITRGVSLLIGEPKKALLKLSGPMIVAMLILAAYNLVNAVWVAGLGSDALAAVGFVTPIFMVVVGLSNGLGAGVSSSISRRIGAQDKRGADNTTMHALLLVLLVSMILTAVLLLTLEPLLSAMGAGSSLGLAMVQIYWLIVKKDTYVSLSRNAFVPSRKVMSDILRVGIPASVEFLLYSIDAIIINSMLVRVSGTDAVAVYTAGWRVIMMATIPLIAIATAEISVAGAAIGARRYGNLPVIHNYSTKLGFAIGTVTALITGIFAPQITMFFTYTPESAHLAGTMVAFMHVMCLFYPFMSPGIMSACLFQGAGKGLTSLLLNVLRDVVLITMVAFILGMVLGLGQEGIWWGIVFGNIAGSLLSYLWARLYISRLMKVKGTA